MLWPLDRELLGQSAVWTIPLCIDWLLGYQRSSNSTYFMRQLQQVQKSCVVVDILRLLGPSRPCRHCISAACERLRTEQTRYDMSMAHFGERCLGGPSWMVTKPSPMSPPNSLEPLLRTIPTVFLSVINHATHPRITQAPYSINQAPRREPAPMSLLCRVLPVRISAHIIT